MAREFKLFQTCGSSDFLEIPFVADIRVKVVWLVWSGVEFVEQTPRVTEVGKLFSRLY